MRNHDKYIAMERILRVHVGSHNREDLHPLPEQGFLPARHELEHLGVIAVGRAQKADKFPINCPFKFTTSRLGVA